MVGQIVGGLTGIASGIIGSRGRKKEQRAAQKEFNQNKKSSKISTNSFKKMNQISTMFRK